jgi:hypothetical protein
MQLILSSGKPFFLINMNSQSSLMTFAEPTTNLALNLNTAAWYRWELGEPMPIDLVLLDRA